MAVYEPGDFGELNDPKRQELERKADKLKKMRAKQKRDNEIKGIDGTPTAQDLEQQFYGKDAIEE